MNDDSLDQIRCGHCNRWVMRYENGAVHSVCPRCGADVSVEVTWLIARLKADIERLEKMTDGDEITLSLDERKDHAVSTQPRLIPTVERPPRGFG